MFIDNMKDSVEKLRLEHEYFRGVLTDKLGIEFESKRPPCSITLEESEEDEELAAIQKKGKRKSRLDPSERAERRYPFFSVK